MRMDATNLNTYRGETKVNRIETFTRMSLMLMALMAIASVDAFAAGAGALGWEAPLGILMASITGPVPYYIGGICIVITFLVVGFGGHLNQFAQGAVVLALCIGGALTAVGLLGNMFGTAGALV